MFQKKDFECKYLEQVQNNSDSERLFLCEIKFPISVFFTVQFRLLTQIIKLPLNFS